ncbi:MAG: hypothetical protein JW909_06755 [Planctomycetes bacterium]|nr:hypothetical protein [Planctomycetota bacterium]
MPRLPSREDLTFRSGGGCIALFGLPFLLGGLMAFAVSAGLLGRVDGPLAVGYVVGGIFTVVGGLLVFARHELAFDPDKGTWHQWWGVLVFRKKQEGLISDITEVELSREVRRSDKSSYVVFPVRVKAGAVTLNVAAPRDFDQARRMAELVAKGIRKPLSDRAGDKPRRIEPENLDKNLKQKLREGEIRIAHIDEPSSKKCTYEVEGTTVRFTMPAGNIPQGVAGLLVALVFPSFVYFVFLRTLLAEKEMPPGIRYVFTGFICVFFILLPLVMGVSMALKAFLTSEHVEVSPSGLVRRKAFGPWAAAAELDADEIEEVVVRKLGTGNASHVVVSSDRMSVRFAGALPENEKRWIASVIQTILAS